MANVDASKQDHQLSSLSNWELLVDLRTQAKAVFYVLFSPGELLCAQQLLLGKQQHRNKGWLVFVSRNWPISNSLLTVDLRVQIFLLTRCFFFPCLSASPDQIFIIHRISTIAFMSVLSTFVWSNLRLNDLILECCIFSFFLSAVWILVWMSQNDITGQVSIVHYGFSAEWFIVPQTF